MAEGARSTREDPLKSFNYIVVIPGFKRVGFEYCSGIEKSAEMINYREGGEARDTAKKSPGLITHAPITLRRGVILPEDNVEQSFDFENWWMQVEFKDPNLRRNFSIILLNNDKTEGPTYSIKNAFPTNFKAFSELGGENNSNIVEELVIEHEGSTRIGNSISPPGPGQSIASSLGIG